ncbi:MAG: ImmA/IrrE family metallo-endopeptidase [Planctomycetaceae bacterium]|nr:ImmA/IrrE family metallo-endopeptidase [Planctomycetaceae bacterium]
MAFDLAILGSKLFRYREQFQATVDDVAAGTGIPVETLVAYEKGSREPTGDHILILADFYKCDYKFFVSNEKLAPFEQTETLFRKHGEALVSSDRWAIQEFLFLCECEEFLLENLPVLNRTPFAFNKHGTHYKKHGWAAAKALRLHLGFQTNEVRLDVFRDFRLIGLHVFRRELANSKISGLFVRHPTAGPCLLINFSEDIYRQRFTAAHEAGHAILDDGSDMNVSFSNWDKGNLSEIRANAFASRFLMPPEFLQGIPEPKVWSTQKVLEWASQLKVSTTALAIALKDAGLIADAMVTELRSVAVPADAKVDAELPDSLSPKSRSRKLDMLKRGLSSFYVDLCFRAYREDVISAGRLAEMLLVSPHEVHSVAELYGEGLAHGD